MSFKTDDKFIFRENNEEGTREKRGGLFAESDSEFYYRRERRIFRKDNEKGTRIFYGVRVVGGFLRIPTYIETEEEYIQRICYVGEIPNFKSDKRELRII